LFRAVLAYSSAAQPDLPRSVVAKITDASKVVSPALRATVLERAMCVSAGFSDENMMRLECVFYTKLARITCVEAGVSVPKIYCAGMTGVHNRLTTGLFVAFARREHVRSAIVMEDLTAARFQNILSEANDSDRARILDAAVNMHAATAKMCRQGLLKDLPVCFHADLITMASGLQLHIKLWMFRGGHRGHLTRKFKRAWEQDGCGLLREESVTSALFALERNYLKRVAPMAREASGRFQRLAHGDLHAGNLAYLPDGSVRMQDFQMYGLGSPACPEPQRGARGFGQRRRDCARVPRAVGGALGDELPPGVVPKGRAHCHAGLVRHGHGAAVLI
jgi:hypothetical protein